MNVRNVCLPQLLVFYQRYLAAGNLSGFVAETAEVYTQGTLMRLAGDRNVSVRRAAILALTSLGDYQANPVMAEALRDEDFTVAVLAETGMKAIWQRDRTPRDRFSLHEIARAVTAGETRLAEMLATEQILKTPDFAEVWHQRGMARYQQGNYARAAADFRRALELNPHHFAAASMMGSAWLRLGESVPAREAFRLSLRINPRMREVRRQLKSL